MSGTLSVNETRDLSINTLSHHCPKFGCNLLLHFLPHFIFIPKITDLALVNQESVSKLW